MKQTDRKNNILWGICMFLLLGISYWLCRYTFFEIHRMKQWTNLLAIISIMILVITTILGKRFISLSTVIGYMGGFILAMIFNTDRIDQHGGKLNNGWIIWGAIFSISILIGIVLSLISQKKVDGMNEN